MAFGDTAVRTLKEGVLPVKITLAEACAKGDLLGYDSGWVLATAATSGVTAVLVAGEAGDAGDIITAFVGAILDGFSEGTPGGLVYASDTAGDYSDSAGTVSQVVGVFTSATEAAVYPDLL